MDYPMPSSDAEYQASSDYDALVRAEVVRADSKRLKAAQAWGKKVVKARMAEGKAAEAVLGKGGAKDAAEE